MNDNDYAKTLSMLKYFYMKYFTFIIIAMFIIGVAVPSAQVWARDSDDNDQSESHYKYSDDEDEDEDEDEYEYEDDEDEDDSYIGSNPSTAPVLNEYDRMKRLQQLLTQLIELLTQLKNKSAVTTPVTPVASSTVQSYTAAVVATHNNTSSCWSIVNAKVYDLTDYISRHPGGSQSVKDICGRDGSSAFNGQHGGDAKPENVLSKYYLAPLAK